MLESGRIFGKKHKALGRRECGSTDAYVSMLLGTDLGDHQSVVEWWWSPFKVCSDK